MSKMTKCPNGHKLPNHTKRGQCTPLYCAEETPKPAKKPREADLATAPPTPTDIAAVANAEAREKLAIKKGQYEAWRELVPVPEGLKGADAEKWADDKLTELLPQAVAHLEKDMKFGSDEQQAKARDKILDATGRGKVEKAVGANQVIVIGNLAGLPWAKAQKPTASVTVVDALPEGKNA
jgi:hypothetical protein